MREESAISLLGKLPETKAEIGTFARSIREFMESGEVPDHDIFLFASRVAAIEKLVTALKKDIFISDVILEAAERDGRKNFEEGNASFRIQETGTSYQYNECGDIEYEEIMDNYNKWADKKKNRETFLKNLTPDSEVYGKDGTMLIPPPKSSTTKVVITLK